MGGALLAGAALLTVQNLATDLHEANRARDALANQVERMGGKPVTGPAGSRGEPGAAVVGPSGPPGPVGAVGPSGKPAPTITPSPGPRGAVGPAGAPGADSTVPGPAGNDATGAPGQAGQDGSPGQPGKDGSNGSPPSGWTYTDENGVTYRCEPVDDFDPDAPRYDCKPTSSPSPTPSPSPSEPQQPSGQQQQSPSSGLLPLNLLADRRRT
ncbi:hypothetical protein AB0D12_31580 [Streptomyces sp. NPDC048479]|uniref:hypothetical protein n=1 Tax=Streptomyces sp. NPDC048479 TaxID=3154725 RepID=UPI00342D62F5